MDVSAARAFLAAHGRVLDRLRLEFQLEAVDAGAVLRALEAYRNPDGGFGWGLEPDLRASESQPAAAMHALEVIAETGQENSPLAREVCDWLDRHTLPDGGLPFALPIGDSTGCAPFWAEADPTSSSLTMTAQLAGNAHRVGRHDRAVADHPWLARATAYSLEAIASLETTPHAYELLFALRFLDAAAGSVVEAEAMIDRLRPLLPADGRMPVEGGAEDEALYPLDFSPRPGSPSRRLFSDDVIAADRSRLAGLQQADGGWTVDFISYSPAAALEWRGYATVEAVMVLRDHPG